MHINGRRPDGYHELQTLFQFIDKCDYLEFELTDSPEIILHSELNELVAANDNLILRAAKLLQKTTQYHGGAVIWLDKQLPMGGGLGGGSSDAATTLVALNELWKTNLCQDKLVELGLQLGADVPVFIRGFAAFAEGVGEHLQPVMLKEKHYLIIVPDVHVSTAEIFNDPMLPRDTEKFSLNSLLQNPWKNDCQNLVINKHPQVAKALGWLIEYAPSRMTGTGACVFAEFEQKQQADKALAELPIDLNGFVAKGLNQSPLSAYLADLN